MAGPSKRASMREGPLAALFRKTDEGEPVEETKEKPKEEFQPPRHPRETGVPHPSLQQPETEQPHIPSPQERLRHAFSSEIPENVMDRPAPAPPREDVYARPEVSGYAASMPVGQPVLRVVGVGGAGVN